jgi:hypothetical protein
MKVLIAGSAGLIGSALSNVLSKQGDSVCRLVRHPANSPEEISWDPYDGVIQKKRLEGFDAVVNLAGENIASGRWTANKKDKIIRSRVNASQFLSKSLASLAKPPAVWVNASAIGYYGNRGAEVMNEQSQAGTGFLADVCRAWEDATHDAQQAGIRVVKLRTGIVLSTKGGALQHMLVPFKLGLGGRLGSGDQYMSWITLNDEVAAIMYCITNRSINGPVNLVAPYAVTNTEFTETLAQVLSRPAVFPVPAFGLKLLLGEMAEALLLGGARILPEKLLNAGFKFQDPELKAALRNILR